MHCAFSRQIFDVTFPRRLSGGKISLNCLPQPVKKASTALVSGSQDQETILKLCIYSGSKKINFWVAKFIKNLINILGLSCHSVLLINFLENLSASILCFPGV